jgi:hypothetical protein
MATRTLPDITYIRECVDYDPTTGAFVWRERPVHHFSRVRDQRWWNTSFARKPAGTAKDRYVRICLGANTFYAHRIAWFLVHGEPVPEFLDHIDGDKKNNRIDNLRAATKAQNYMNTRARPSRSGVKGVFPKQYARGIRFAAFIKLAGKRYHLGQFATLEEATKARHEAAERLHGEFARHD